MKTKSFVVIDQKFYAFFATSVFIKYVQNYTLIYILTIKYKQFLIFIYKICFSEQLFQ